MSDGRSRNPAQFRRGSSPAARDEGREKITNLGRTFWWSGLGLGWPEEVARPRQCGSGEASSTAEQSSPVRRSDGGSVNARERGPGGIYRRQCLLAKGKQTWGGFTGLGVSPGEVAALGCLGDGRRAVWRVQSWPGARGSRNRQGGQQGGQNWGRGGSTWPRARGG